MADNFKGSMLAKLHEKFGQAAAEPSAPEPGEAGSKVLARKLSEGGKVDRRKLKKTGRTEFFQARVTAATLSALHKLAKSQKKTLGEVLEEAVALLEMKAAQLKK